MQTIPLTMTRRSLLFALFLAATGCEAPTAPGDIDNLQAARARWLSQGGPSYSYELNQGCFCVLGGRRITVTVQNGAVTGADYADSGAAVEVALLTYIPTIPDLFDMVEDALNPRPAYFFASYDPVYGYPTRIEVDQLANAEDDNWVISARDLVITRAFSR